MQTVDELYPDPSRRVCVYARNVVATSQPLAVAAGLEMLRRGGNAVDAAVAAAAALTVVEPTSNGLGSDAFALVWDGEKLHGINGSGRAPKNLPAQKFLGLDKMPVRGWDPVTVPGAVDVWVRLSERFGKLPFGKLLEPAVCYAERGFHVSPVTGEAWQRAAKVYKNFAAFCETFLFSGRAPEIGRLVRLADHARTLREIARSRGEEFYRGKIARAIAGYAAKDGGYLSAEDLAAHRSEWVEPVGVDYRGRRLHEIPPNGQGIVALIALGILRHFDFSGMTPETPVYVHLAIEAVKMAFAEAHAHVCDPEFATVGTGEMLDDDFLKMCAGRIDAQRAAEPRPLLPACRDTVYLAAADEAGMMVSFIQSNYMGFGSGIVVPGTGIALQNRGHGFSTDPDHPNAVRGGKRPFHTIIPGFVTADGGPLMSFGVMGGHMQPQGHVQMMNRIFDFGRNPQAASDAPRWHVCEDFSVALEPGFDPAVASELERRGHVIVRDPSSLRFGGAQIVMKIDGGYVAASDHRKDGLAAGF